MTNNFVPVRYRTLNMADRQRDNPAEYTTTEPFNDAYYRERRYLDEYTSRHRRLIRRQLDRDLLAKLGY